MKTVFILLKLCWLCKTVIMGLIIAEYPKKSGLVPNLAKTKWTKTNLQRTAKVFLSYLVVIQMHIYMHIRLIAILSLRCTVTHALTHTYAMHALTYTHTHTHSHMSFHIYIYIYREREREKEKERVCFLLYIIKKKSFLCCTNM